LLKETEYLINFTLGNAINLPNFPLGSTFRSNVTA